MKQFQNDDYNPARALDALHSIDPDNVPGKSTEPWVVVSTSAKHIGITFEQWLDWTSKSKAYEGEENARARWKSFKAAQMKPGPLYEAAHASGWKPKHSSEYGSGVYTPPAIEPVQEKKGPPPALRFAFERTQTFSPAQPYAAKKGFLSVPELSHLRQFPDNDSYHPGALFLPLYDQGEMVSAVVISPEGDKQNFAGAKMGKGFATVGTIEPAQPVHICEGLGAAWACYQATGTAAVAACGNGRMGTVAKAVQHQHPDSPIVLVPDTGKEGEADKIATALGCTVAAMPEGSASNYDAWDYANDHSADKLKALLQDAKSPAHSNTAQQGENDTQAQDNAQPAQLDCGDSRIPPPEKRPCYVVFDDWYKAPNGEKFAPGVWYFAMKVKGKGESEKVEETQQRICSPLYVTATTADAYDGSYGRMLRFKNTHGNWREWAMPMAMMAGDGSELRAILLGMGVEIPTVERASFTRYLENQHPKDILQCVAQTGWVDAKCKAFVLPNGAIGPGAAGVTYQNEDREASVIYRAAGTLEGWRAGVSMMAVNNPMLALALCLAFAGPLLAKVHGENGGVHYFGESSTGKTSVLHGGSSVWGEPEAYKRTWRTTDNGLEGAAAMLNDSLLTLDEIKQAAPKVVDETIYMVGNGQGKGRANRSGGGRTVARWRCSVLSTGEMSIATKLAEGGLRIHAGQEVRFLDIPCDNRAAGGVWDTLHGHPDAKSLSDSVVTEAKAHYGHAGKAFLERLAAEDGDLPGMLKAIQARPEFNTGGGSQEQRVAGRFALLAVAGELATYYDITGWPEGEAIRAAVAGFKAWQWFRDSQDGANAERGQVVRKVLDFIEQHGDSRFSDVTAPPPDPSHYQQKTHNRAGWWRDTEGGGRVYLFNSVGLKEALKGYDFKRGIRWLQEAGMLPPTGSDGSHQTQVRIKELGGAKKHLYEVHPDSAGGTV